MRNMNYLKTSTRDNSGTNKIQSTGMIEIHVRNRVLNDSCVSGNNENRRFCFQYIFEMCLGGTTIVLEE